MRICIVYYNSNVIKFFILKIIFIRIFIDIKIEKLMIVVLLLICSFLLSNQRFLDFSV